jgi:endonuclease IV
MLNLGLKLWSTNINYLPAAQALYKQNIFSYIELLVKPGSNDAVSAWQNAGIPFALHAPHSLAGMNPAQRQARTANRKAIHDLNEFALALHPRYVVFHGGLNGDINETIDQLNEFKETFPDSFKNALIENKPDVGLNGEKCIGSSAESISLIMKSTGMGFCLDFGHAMCHAAFLKEEFEKIIAEFFALRPGAFHLSDGLRSSSKDQHLHLGKGDFPLEEMLSRIPKNAHLLIETEKASPDDLQDYIEDATFVKAFC